LSPGALQENKENKGEVSLYGEGKVSSKCLADNVIKLKKAFPKLPNGFYDILEQMLDEERFTDSRFTDAVNNLIKTCAYPEPTIANILGFDKKKKLYTWHELAEISKDYSPQQRSNFWKQYTHLTELDKYIPK